MLSLSAPFTTQGPKFEGIRIYATQARVEQEFPIQLYLENNSEFDDRVDLMHNFANTWLDRSEKAAKLSKEIREFNSGKSDIYPENLRQRMINIIKAVKPNRYNQKRDDGQPLQPNESSAWSILTAQRDKLIELLKNPDYAFKKTKYGLLFCPRDKKLGPHGY